MKIINYENLRSFCYSNDKLIDGEIKGIAIDFNGLGGQGMHKEHSRGDFFAKYGIIFINPYSNPWGWMNSEEVLLTDEILDVLFEKYNLDEKTPIASTGGSMGGQCALVYCAYAKRTPVTCVANCPVCDMPYHFTEREDLPRTIYSALRNEGLPFDEALIARSPLHLACGALPKINYHIFHCTADGAVNIDAHSNKLTVLMEANGYKVTYDVVKDRGHCDLGIEATEKYYQYIINDILNRA